MERILDKLKNEGICLTPQRLAIIRYLSGNRTHPTADEIYSHIRNEYPTISKATVYSTLKILSDMGVLIELSIRKRGEASFDLVEGEHHHLLCKICGNIVDIIVDPCKDCNIMRAADSQGHRVEEIQAYLYGICCECIRKGNQ